MILELVKSDPGITMKEISEKCNVSVKTIKRDIEELRSAGKLRREGGRKKGNWVAV
ncbi:MAG: DeoR family transcriptional regulator [Bacteroidales bacterium]|nr:DeoR family transcriptional regulator [Bacteroidales bacterium]MCF8402526.1 DeoR family transcriptional regulator [Bacteroidales bacterium]